MNELNEIDYTWGPDRLNLYLIRQYCFDLFDFAYALAVAVSENQPIKSWKFWSLKKIKVEKFKQYYDDIQRLEEYYEKLVRALDTHLENVEYWALAAGSSMESFIPPYHPIHRIVEVSEENVNDSEIERTTRNFHIDARQNVINKIYKLNEILLAEIDYYRRYLSYYKNNKGRPVFPKTIIAAIWSCVMRDEHGVHYTRVIELFHWFSNYLKETSYGKALSDSVEKSPPAEREISRFHNAFPDIFENDKSQIFFHDYSKSEGRNKTFSFQIDFAIDEPKFIPLVSLPSEDSAIKLKFPNEITFPEIVS